MFPNATIITLNFAGLPFSSLFSFRIIVDSRTFTEIGVVLPLVQVSFMISVSNSLSIARIQ